MLSLNNNLNLKHFEIFIHYDYSILLFNVSGP